MQSTPVNLYKFMATFGAVLFFSGLLAYVVLTERSRKIETSIERKMVVFSHERQSFIGKIKEAELHKAGTDSLQQVKASVLAEEKIPEYKDRIDRSTLQLNLEKQLYDEQVGYREKITLVIYGIWGAGFLLMLIGLLFWYTRLQRPCNRLLRDQARKQLSE